MRVELTGVLDDGTSSVPVNARRTLNMSRGTDLQLDVRVVTPSGSAVVLNAPGDELLLTVKKRPQADPSIVKKAVLTSGIGVFTLGPGDTQRLVPGIFGYDVWLTKDGARDPVIPLSPFNLLASAAAVPSAPPPLVDNKVEDDTEPTFLEFGIDITGFSINYQINYSPTPLVKAAVITNALGGLAQVNRQVGDLRVGRFGFEIEITTPGPIVQTSDVGIINIREQIA